MYIDIETSNVSGNSQDIYTEKNISVMIDGLMFVNEDVSSDCLEKYIVNEYLKNSLDFKNIFGSFVCIIKNNETQEVSLFSDNSGIRSYFISRLSVSSSLLELVSKEKGEKYFDVNSVAELLAYGNVFLRKTLVDGVDITSPEFIYKISNGQISKIKKNIGYIDEESNIASIKKYFEYLSKRIANEKVSMDLTGGFDSRMVYSILKNNNTKMSLFTSGNIDNDDVKIPIKIAEKMNEKITVFAEKRVKINTNLIYELFYYSDGTMTFADASSIRIMGFAKEREKNGYTVRITGDGGVLYKDWWWLQDFPFYNIKAFRMNRFFEQRIGYLKINSDIFTEEQSASFKKCKERLLLNIAKCKKNYNSETYDYIYYYLFGSKLSWGYNCFSRFVNAYAPLWEHELVKVAYKLPRRKRFYNNFQREVITENCKAISKEKTNYGFNSSSKIIDKVFDTRFFVKQYIEKAIRVIGRKYLNKTFSDFVDKIKPEEEIKKLGIVEDALVFAKESGILKDNSKNKQIESYYISRILLLFMLKKEFNIQMPKTQGYKE